MGHADGQKKKLPRSGELITTRDGTLLFVLGRPRAMEPGSDLTRLTGLLRGTLVVLTPAGHPALHVPDAHASRPIFVEPWEWGWEPIDGGDEDGIPAFPPPDHP